MHLFIFIFIKCNYRKNLKSKTGLQVEIRSRGHAHSPIPSIHFRLTFFKACAKLRIPTYIPDSVLFDFLASNLAKKPVLITKRPKKD